MQNLPQKDKPMTGDQLRTYRIQAGLLTAMLAKRLGVSASTVSRAECNGDRFIRNGKLKTAFRVNSDAFVPWSKDRDGPRLRMPHMAKRGEGSIRGKTHPKSQAMEPSEKQGQKPKQGSLSLATAAGAALKMQEANTDRCYICGAKRISSLSLVRVFASAKDVNNDGLLKCANYQACDERHAAKKTGPLDQREASPKCDPEDSMTPESALDQIKRWREAAIKRHGACPECGGAPISNVGSYMPDWNDKVRCGACGYGNISLWKWCGRTEMPRPMTGEPELGNHTPEKITTTEAPPSLLVDVMRGLDNTSIGRRCSICGAESIYPKIGDVPNLLKYAQMSAKKTTSGWRCIDATACEERTFVARARKAPRVPARAPDDHRPRNPNFQVMTFEQGEEMILLLGKLVEAWEK